jgi:hypothetical protein
MLVRNPAFASAALATNKAATAAIAPIQAALRWPGDNAVDRTPQLRMVIEEVRYGTSVPVVRQLREHAVGM